MTSPLVAGLIAGSLFLSIACPAVSEETVRGAQLAAACASCHRLDGSATGIPSIVGWEPGKLTEAMRAFRSEDTPSHIMRAVSLSLSDDEVAAVADHLATLGKGATTP